jgi:hypothetical protein
MLIGGFGGRKMRWTRSAAVALVFCVAACSGKKEAPSGGSVGPGGRATPEPATAAGAAQALLPKAAEMGSFKFGSGLAVDGTASGEGRAFAQGETLHCTFILNNPPAGSAVKIVVVGLSDKRKVHEEQKNPAGPSNSMSFTLSDTRSWAPGDYRVEIQLLAGADSKGLGVFDFKIDPAKR